MTIKPITTLPEEADPDVTDGVVLVPDATTSATSSISRSPENTPTLIAFAVIAPENVAVTVSVVPNAVVR